MVTFFLFVLLTFCSVNAYQGGAPCSQLSSLQPGPPHGEAQTSPSPYALRVLDQNGKLVSDGHYSGGERYTVEIYSRCEPWTSIRGFLLVAKEKRTRDVIGQFLKDDTNFWQAVQYPCRDKNLGSVTHYSSFERTQPLQFHYQLDESAANSADVVFEATVVQSFHKYWKGLTWPEPANANCQCKDKKDFNCANFAKSGQCDVSSVRDNCLFTCNNCTNKH